MRRNLSTGQGLRKAEAVEIDEDAELMARFVRTRDRAVFTQLFDRYERAIYGHVLRFVKDGAVAEELVQDVFVRVYTTKRYAPDHRFKTWLYKVATNVCLNELRKPVHRAAHEPLDAPSAEDLRPRELRSADAGPDAALEGQELADRVAAALGRLPPKQRAALLMVRQDGLTHDEIARILKTSVSAVKSLVHRALEALRLEVEAAAQDHPPVGRKAMP